MRDIIASRGDTRQPPPLDFAGPMITLAGGVHGHGRNIMTQDLASSAARSAQGLTLFVLAHPDDELAFAPILHRLARAQQPVRLIYLTDGAAPFASAALRNAESAAALAWLGIDPSSLWFAGSEIGIADGQLYRHLPSALDAIEQRVPADSAIAAIYTLAWEGGHPDHDAAHIVAAAFAAARGCEDRLPNEVAAGQRVQGDERAEPHEGAPLRAVKAHHSARQPPFGSGQR